MKAICIAAVVVSTTASTLSAGTKPRLPGPDATPREIVQYLAEAPEADLSDPSSPSGRRLLSAGLVARWARQARVLRWTSDPDDALDVHVITGSYDSVTVAAPVTMTSETAFTAHFVDEAKGRHDSTFEFVRENGEWKVSNVVYGTGTESTLVKLLDEIGSRKLPGRLEITSEYDVDLSKGTIYGERGTSLDHNGSDVLFFEKAGLIFFERPKAAIAGAVKPKALLFAGTFSHGRVEGIAYTFKKGCSPAPYEVKGSYRFQGFGGYNEITLAGAAPIADPKSCAILGYTTKSPNARLRFTFTEGDI